MYAIEFRAKLKNGIIEVPREYRSRLKNNVKVIVLTDEEETSVNMIENLMNSPLRVENFSPFTREQIYDRS